MKRIIRIVSFVICVTVAATANVSAANEWLQGETRTKEIEGCSIAVDFIEVTESGECMVAVAVPAGQNKFEVYFYFPAENKPVKEEFILDSKQRKISIACDKGQLTFSIDNKIFNKEVSEVVSRE